MSLSGIVDPQDLALLTRVLDAHCVRRKIPTGEERDELARRLIGLFQRGMTTEDMLATAIALPPQEA